MSRSTKMKQLEALMDIQVASTLMREESLVDVHPVDANYEKLGAKMAPLTKYSREFKAIQKYLDNGYDPSALGYTISLQNVFTVSMPNGTDDFEKFQDVRPRKLLWHGSRLCNYVGILNQGLRIAPPEAPMTGYLFGKGIYWADRVSKSAPFCHPTQQNPIGLLLLGDVVVGDPYKVKKPEFITQLPTGKHSTLALAKTIPDPTKDELGEDKVIVPCGPGISSGEKDVFLEDQEYFIYQKQCRIKYLLKVRFNFLQNTAQ